MNAYDELPLFGYATTFPLVASLTPTQVGSNSVNHNIAMPAVVNADDLLIALVANDGAVTVTKPSGWEQFHSTISGSATVVGSYYRIADGTEGGTTVNFVTSAAETAAAHVYRITGWHGSTPPEVGTPAIATSANPNPPTLSPSWGAEDTLWLSLFGGDAVQTPSAYPTSYAYEAVTFAGGADPQCTIASCRRELNVATEDPGAFTTGSPTEQWVAQTIAIRPAGTSESHVRTIRSSLISNLVDA